MFHFLLVLFKHFSIQGFKHKHEKFSNSWSIKCNDKDDRKCVYKENVVTPGSLQFLHTEQHVYLKSRILLATFFIEVGFFWVIIWLASHSWPQSREKKLFLIFSTNKFYSGDTLALIAFSSSSYSSFIIPLSSHSLWFLWLGFTSVPQLWEYHWALWNPPQTELA